MDSYSARSTQVALDSSIAVMVLLNPDATDMELWPICPPPQSGLTTPEEFTARQLRPVGVLGLCVTESRAAFKEPLDVSTVDALARAFTAYVNALLGQRQAGDSLEWCERLFALPDTRPEKFN